LALAILAAGCAPENHENYRKSWERVTLPGFSILMPPGKVVETSREPSIGKHQREISGSLVDHWAKDIATNGSVMASWSTDSSTFEEWKRDSLPIMLTGIENATPGAKVIREELLDDDHWIFVLGTDTVPLALGTIRCDQAFQILVVYAHYHDAERQVADLREIMDSVHCEVSAENLAMTRAATRLPEKFGLVKQSNPQQYRSLDDENLALNFTTDNMFDDKKLHRVLVAQIVSNTYGMKVLDSDMKEVAVPEILHHEPTMLLRVTLPTDKSRVYVGTLFCEDVGLSLMSFWTAPTVSDNLAIQRLSQVGCPSTPSTPSPPFESLVEAACTNGDAAACALRTQRGS
jgi:hypothetical protein